MPIIPSYFTTDHAIVKSTIRSESLQINRLSNTTIYLYDLELGLHRNYSAAFMGGIRQLVTQNRRDFITLRNERLSYIEITKEKRQKSLYAVWFTQSNSFLENSQSCSQFSCNLILGYLQYRLVTLLEI